MNQFQLFHRTGSRAHARHFLKLNGNVAIFLHATKVSLEAEMELLKKHQLKPLQLVQLQPYVRGSALVVGVYNRKAV
ncbi:rRNA 2'-O-methyltransferase fibrillarin [Drosophila madeirensis]|uniref:rRNA 2'-O-methyltransferase fibrillarin n=1 Tax=Drosophila madeirensis TaxID=30013 RepID=A0AAU9EVX9_DROMD